jgi:hypothetical protein
VAPLVGRLVSQIAALYGLPALDETEAAAFRDQMGLINVAVR